MRSRWFALVSASLFVLACSSDDNGTPASNTAGSSGKSGAAGSAGSATGGATGSGGTSGTGASSGTGGKSGTGGTSGSGGSTSVGGSAGSGAAGDGGGSGGGAGTGGGSGATGGSGGATTACTNPLFVTSDPNGGWSDGGYYVHNNMWNSAAVLGPETLYACAYNNWYVVSNQTNDAGAVKTYPNVHKDYSNVLISSFTTITSTFAESSPHVGIYDVAYDIWTNGIATSGSTEIMIWTENFNQVPSGSNVTSVSLGGRTYDVFKTSNNGYIAFVPTAVFTSGTVDLLEMFNWIMSRGWLASNSTLGQIDFGVEIVSTNGADATFTFTDFSITSN